MSRPLTPRFSPNDPHTINFYQSIDKDYYVMIDSTTHKLYTTNNNQTVIGYKTKKQHTRYKSDTLNYPHPIRAALLREIILRGLDTEN